MSLKILLSAHPRSFWVLAFGELWSTFSYFGTQTILALYFIHVFHLTRAESYLLYGAYAAFAYSLPLLGGIVADKAFGSKNTAILGSSLNILGNILLMSFHHYMFCLGLAVSLVGAGLYKSTSSQLVGTLYPTGDIKKERAFTLFYLAVNVGGVAGPLIYGWMVYKIGWHSAFACSALGILMSLLWFIRHPHKWDELKTLKPLKFLQKSLLILGIISVCIVISFSFYRPALANVLIMLVFIMSIIYLSGAILKYKNTERNRLFALLLISFFGMFYFAAGLQIGTSITLFIQSKIQAGVINTHFPASVFSALYPFFVLLLAPLFAFLWRTLRNRHIVINAAAKLMLGMLLAVIGICAFAFAASSHFVISGILMGNLFLSAGELALAPAVYTAISDLSPPGMKNTMMGCWLLFVAFGGYLSSLLANASHLITRIAFFQGTEYTGEFLFIAGFTLIVVLLLALSLPRLSQMMQ
jgi:POT family proton-dependent oligopeptide transporter